ncbi:MAG: hypothetical protein ABEJ82_04480 [Haloplanus sp.]
MPGGRPLSVDADCTLTVDGTPVSVRGYGDLLVVDAPTLGAIRSLGGGTRASVVDAVCRRSDLTVDCRVRGRSVARVGAGVESGPLSRAVGAAPARLSLGGLLLALLDYSRI